MAITKRARRIQAEKMQQEMQRTCDEWNSEHPVGTPVMVKLDGQDTPVETVTRSKAQILSGHSVVIWLEGVSGCYLLTHVRAAPTPEEKEDAADDLVRTLAPYRP